MPIIKKEERIQIYTTIFHPKKLEKATQIKPKSRRRKEIIKDRVQINEIENRKTVNIKTKSWFFEKIDEFEKSLAILTKEKREDSNQSTQG